MTAGVSDVRGFYAELGVTLPAGERTNVQVACFADRKAHRNGDRRASCSVSLSTGAWCCHGCGASGGAYDAALVRGRSPREAMESLQRWGLAESPVRDRPARTPAAQAPAVRVSEAQAARHRTALLSDAGAIARLAELRGWTAEAITELGVGYDRGRVVFPVRDGAGLLVGVLRYAPNPALRNGAPKMLADAGSRRDLFPAPESIGGDLLWLVEGEPDAVAAFSLGLPAVGVPGSNGWRSASAPRFAGRHVVVLCDCDVPGRRLAATVAHDLLPYAASVRVLDVWAARTDGYDLSDIVVEHAKLAAIEPVCEDWREQTRALLIAAAASVAPLKREAVR
jgi:hypothetical protein